MQGLKRHDSVNGLNSGQYFKLLQIANFKNESNSILMMYAKTCEKMGGVFYSEYFNQIIACEPSSFQNLLTFDEFKFKLKQTFKLEK